MVLRKLSVIRENKQAKAKFSIKRLCDNIDINIVIDDISPNYV